MRALTVGTWLTIDAVLDNAISNLLDEGLSAHAPDVVGVQSLRERGWAVRAAHPERGLGPGGWPPREVRFDVALSDDDLDRLTDLLRHATVTTRQLLESDLPPTVRTLQEESLVHAQEAQEALDAIRRVR